MNRMNKNIIWIFAFILLALPIAEARVVANNTATDTTTGFNDPATLYWTEGFKVFNNCTQSVMNLSVHVDTISGASPSLVTWTLGISEDNTTITGTPVSPFGRHTANATKVIAFAVGGFTTNQVQTNITSLYTGRTYHFFIGNPNAGGSTSSGLASKINGYALGKKSGWQTNGWSDYAATNDITFQINSTCTGVPPPVTNFTIITKDKTYNYATINSFNATIRAKGYTTTWNYTTTTGTITTRFLSSATRILNITITPAGAGFLFDINNTLNYNSTTNLVRNFTSLRYKFNLTAAYKGKNKNFTASLRDVNGTETLSVTSANNIANARPLINHYYNITIDAPTYAFPSTKLSRANTKFRQINFSLQITNTFNFIFRNALTNALLTPNNISVELISASQSANSSTNTGYWNRTLLIPDDYTIRAKSLNFFDSFWFYSLTNRTYNNLTLYMTSNSTGTAVSAFVYDQTGQALEGAYVKVKRYDTTTNSYIVKEIGQTNYIGKTIIHPVLNSEFYKFTIEYGGVVVKETGATYIYNTDPIVFYVTIGADNLENYFTAQGVSTSIDYNNVTKNVRFTYNDVANAIYGGQLDCFGTYGVSKTTIGSTAVNSPSSTILINLPGVNGTLYNCNGYILGTSASQKTLREQITIDNYVHERLNSPMMFFLMIILTITFAFLVTWDLRLASIMTPMPMFFFTMMGLVTINKGIAMGFLALGLVMALVIKREWA